MAQKPYFRDVWALGPPSNGYPGAFPRGLMNKIKERWLNNGKKIMICSGKFNEFGWDTIDINPAVKPSMISDCEILPIKNETYDFVMADPPYSDQWAERLYNLKCPSVVKIMNEMARICKPGGTVLLLHTVVPLMHPGFKMHTRRLKQIALVGVFTISGFANMRALTVWRKANSLDEFRDDNDDALQTLSEAV